MELILLEVVNKNGDNEMLFREEINHTLYRYRSVITYEALEEGLIDHAIQYADERFEMIRKSD